MTRRLISSRKRAGLVSTLALGAFAMLGPVGAANAEVTIESPNDVAIAIGGSAGSYAGTTDDQQGGVGDAAQAGFPLQGTTFGVLSSGDVELANENNDSDHDIGPNNDGDNAGDTPDPTPGRGDANDAVTLKVDTTVPAGQTCLLVDYKFMSEEFPEFVNSGFNDAFIAELDATNWSVTGSVISAPGDFAAGYGDQVSVDTLGPTVVSPAGSAGTPFDAGTGVLTAKIPVTPGAHSVFLSVFDAGDSIYDSAAFVDNLRFNTEPPSTCRAPDLFGGQVGVTLNSGKAKFVGNKALIDIFCNLPLGATDPCVGNLVVKAGLPSANNKVALRGKKKKVAKGTYSIPPQTVGQAQLKLNKKGKKRLFDDKNKVKGKLKIINTVNGASDTTGLKLKKARG
jgi:hypothetical protein